MAPIKSNNPLVSYFDFFSRSGLDAVNEYVAPQGLSASGGVISDYEVSGTRYRAHIFTASGPFNVTALSTDFPNSIDYLVIGGGGGGGNSDGGGGGAGGYRTSMPEGPGGPSPSAESTITATVNNYSIRVEVVLEMQHQQDILIHLKVVYLELLEDLLEHLQYFQQ